MNMETVINTIPGYRVYEYLLALAPHEELGQRISKLKEAFAEKYKTEDGGRGRPWPRPGGGEPYFIWGATAAMLRNLYRFLSA